MAEREPEAERALLLPRRRRRRLPRRLPRRRHDVYVNMKTDFRAQLSRCQKLLLAGPPSGQSGAGPGAELCVHGLGLAINRAINIALQLEAAAGGTLRLAAHTSTVELADEADDDGEAPGDGPDGEGPAGRTRNNSAIHIRLCRVAAPPQ